MEDSDGAREESEEVNDQVKDVAFVVGGKIHVLTEVENDRKIENGR